MSLEMVRIDDRFIHGQVVVGWCPRVEPDRLILCDDEIAGNAWESELYEGAAMDYPTSICSVSRTAQFLKSPEAQQEKLFLIVSSPHILVELMAAGVKFTEVVVGGMHYETGKRKIANFIYINDADLQDFQFLFEHDVLIEGKDLPDCKPINLIAKLGLQRRQGLTGKI